MNLKEITEKQFKKYAEKDKLYTFHQTKEWAELKEKNGWKNYYVGLFKKEKMIGAALLLSKKTPIKKEMFYSPRGFLIDFDNEEIVLEFSRLIKEFAKKHNGIFIKIDPTIILQQRNADGDIVENGINNFKIIDLLKKNGYHHHGVAVNNQNELQPRWIFVLPVKEKTKNQVYAGFNRTTKRRIRKCQESGVEVEVLRKDELLIFKNIMEHTSSRRGFLDRPFSYYENMLNILKEHCRVYVAYLKTEEAEKKINLKIKVENDKIKQLSKKEQNDKIKQDIEKCNENICNLKNEILEIKKLEEEKGNKIPLGATMVLLFGKEITFLFGGSYKEYMNYASQYLIQWQIISDAIDEGYDLCNFYGIDGNLKENGEMHGVYEFKRGFGGEVREYIGEFDLIVSKFYYALYKITFKVYKTIKNFKFKKKRNN